MKIKIESAFAFADYGVFSSELKFPHAFFFASTSNNSADSCLVVMASVNENPNDEKKGYFDMLPDVALIEILSYLHATEVSKVTSISRRLFDLALTRTAGR